jgi:hypothetical protein
MHYLKQFIISASGAFSMAGFSSMTRRCITLRKHRSFLIAAGALVLLLSFGTVATACGGDDSTTTTSSSLVASSDTTQAGTTSSTPATEALSTSEAQTSTTAAAATTAAPATTTTAKATTTTAKATTTTKKATTTTVKPTTTTIKGKVVLTLTGPSGTVELTMAELRALSASSGYGGWKNQLGNITAPVSYKGVRVTTLMELVGGGGSVTVIASDGYEQTLSGSELAGEVNLYDPATGEQITSISGGVKTILAYAKGGSAIGSSEGPLRIAFVSPEKDQVTDSSAWVKMVVKIKVN